MDYASEYRYRDPHSGCRANLGLLITQSGETADTLAAQRELGLKGSKTLAICNVVGAAIARDAQGTITTNAGPEIGVAEYEGVHGAADGAVSAGDVPGAAARDGISR